MAPDDLSATPRELDNLPTVTADLLYIQPSDEAPYVYAYEPPEGVPWSNAEYAPHAVAIHNARAISGSLSLDREGIAFARSPSAVKDFYDEAEVDSLGHAEAAALVARITGASRVEVFDHTQRKSTSEPSRAPAFPRQPVTRVHNDYTVGSGPQRVRDLMGGEADELLKRRFAFINVWRPIKGPVVNTPLTVCDARSAAPEDFVVCQMRYADRTGEIYTVTHSPAHRWLYFPRMTTDETILIKCYDSREDVARFAPHVAFEDPATPPGAAPRESIEIRTVAFF